MTSLRLPSVNEEAVRLSDGAGPRIEHHARESSSGGPRLLWTESRQALEVEIQAAKAQDHASWTPDLASDEARLQARLEKLKLDMQVVSGDGNCQFRSVSQTLWGTQDYHLNVRQKAVGHMREHQEEYQAFLGEGIDSYLDSMSRTGTWGDELTLRAICDSYGIIVNVLTSDQHNWFMRYKPREMKLLKEVFLTYIAPVHYNAIRRRRAQQVSGFDATRQTLLQPAKAAQNFNSVRSSVAPNTNTALRAALLPRTLFFLCTLSIRTAALLSPTSSSTVRIMAFNGVAKVCALLLCVMLLSASVSQVDAAEQSAISNSGRNLLWDWRRGGWGGGWGGRRGGYRGGRGDHEARTYNMPHACSKEGQTAYMETALAQDQQDQPVSLARTQLRVGPQCAFE
ncbi:hypothetical protein WJX73_009217 [Symbiochloris irregularis]|uniref:OTU domain-containing protein n=1 Tax=Symbiochloris irregularis TaxID=706552 RepID=A0AAW1NQC3_9CHLO